MRYVIIFRGKGHNRKGNAIIEADGWYYRNPFVVFWRYEPFDGADGRAIHPKPERGYEHRYAQEELVAYHEHCIFSVTPIEEE